MMCLLASLRSEWVSGGFFGTPFSNRYLIERSAFLVENLAR